MVASDRKKLRIELEGAQENLNVLYTDKGAYIGFGLHAC